MMVGGWVTFGRVRESLDRDDAPQQKSLDHEGGKGRRVSVPEQKKMRKGRSWGTVRLSGAAWDFGGTWVTIIWAMLSRESVHFAV